MSLIARLQCIFKAAKTITLWLIGHIKEPSIRSNKMYMGINLNLTICWSHELSASWLLGPYCSRQTAHKTNKTVSLVVRQSGEPSKRCQEVHDSDIVGLVVCRFSEPSKKMSKGLWGRHCWSCAWALILRPITL